MIECIPICIYKPQTIFYTSRNWPGVPTSLYNLIMMFPTNRGTPQYYSPFNQKGSCHWYTHMHRKRNEVLMYPSKLPEAKKDKTPNLRKQWVQDAAWSWRCRLPFSHLRGHAAGIHIPFCPKGVNISSTLSHQDGWQNGSALVSLALAHPTAHPSVDIQHKSDVIAIPMKITPNTFV